MSEHALRYVTRTVDGAEVKFGKITARDRAGVLANLKSARREALRKHLDETGLNAEQKFAELETFEEVVYGEERFILHLNTPEGQAEVGTIAYAKYNQGDAAAALDAVEADDGSLLKLICETCNLRPQEPAKPPATDQAGPGPNAEAPQGTDPLAGKVYGK